MQADELKAKLIESIGSELGDYHYNDECSTEQKIIALWVVNNADEDPPADHKRSGIECLIYPPLPRGDPFYGGTTEITHPWTVILIQHDRAKSVGSAVKILLKTWPQIKPAYIRASKEFDEQATIEIEDKEIV
jgi:hypothetical protein